VRLLYFLSDWLHIIAAAIWVGGMIFLSAVVVPLLRHPEIQPHRSRLISLLGLRFRVIGWVALTTLLVTGLYNIFARGFTLQDALSGSLWEGEFGRTLVEKLFTFVIIILLSAAHDFWVGPKVSLLAQKGNSAELERWRKAASWLGRINLLLALLMVAFGVMLVRGHPF
jgi:putative copper export protein